MNATGTSTGLRWSSHTPKQCRKEAEEEEAEGDRDEFLLFGLYGVGRSYVIAGDVAFLPGVDGVSLPPVAFPAQRRKHTQV